MSYKKKKDEMSKTELQREVEFWKAEYNRAKRVQQELEKIRDEQQAVLDAMPDVVRQMYEKRAKRRTMR